jgi:hypothetical protein
LLSVEYCRCASDNIAKGGEVEASRWLRLGDLLIVARFLGGSAAELDELLTGNATRPVGE